MKYKIKIILQIQKLLIMIKMIRNRFLFKKLDKKKKNKSKDNQMLKIFLINFRNNYRYAKKYTINLIKAR